MAEYQERVGRRIAAAREAKGWSQTQLAHALSPTKTGKPRDSSSVSRYERGKVLPGPDTLEEIARALDITVASLVAGEAQPGTPDLITSLNGDGAQLDRIESRLDALLAHFRIQWPAPSQASPGDDLERALSDDDEQAEPPKRDTA